VTTIAVSRSGRGPLQRQRLDDDARQIGRAQALARVEDFETDEVAVLIEAGRSPRGVVRLKTGVMIGAFFLSGVDAVLERQGLFFRRYMDDVLVLAPTR